MNRYILIRRLRGPAFLLLVGGLALLNQANIMSWGKSWPFFLILAGVLALAERAALASGEGYPPPQYPGGVNPASSTGVPPYPGPASAIVASTDELGKDREGGQS
ncbi:MAG TPA: DUF5668 domain-containing protein [Terracidiphilus sp.]|jgi:LiaI-LiaF-like transmembrane region|nr:DUF5668 domain-containing protein [Terracidiphilus sp.]